MKPLKPTESTIDHQEIVFDRRSDEEYQLELINKKHYNLHLHSINFKDRPEIVHMITSKYPFVPTVHLLKDHVLFITADQWDTARFSFYTNVQPFKEVQQISVERLNIYRYGTLPHDMRVEENK